MLKSQLKFSFEENFLKDLSNFVPTFIYTTSTFEKLEIHHRIAYPITITVSTNYHVPKFASIFLPVTILRSVTELSREKKMFEASTSTKIRSTRNFYKLLLKLLLS